MNSQYANSTAGGNDFVRAAWPRRSHFALLAAAGVFLAAYGSWVPLEMTPISLATALDRFSEIPGLGEGPLSRTDIATNVLLFVPIGFLALGAIGVDRRLRWTLLAIPPVVMSCALLAIAIEFSQLWFADRNTSVTDMACLTIGGLAGCMLWTVAGQTLTDWVRIYTRDAGPRHQVDWLLQAYVLGFAVYAVLPLDLTISVADLYHKFEAGKVVLVPFSHGYGSAFVWLYQMVKDVVVFAPIGAWAATAFLPRGCRVRSLPASILLGGLAVLVVELAQLLVASRFTDTTDLITGTLGVTLGAVVMQRLGGVSDAPSAADTAATANVAWLKWLGIAAIYAAVLTAGYWFPFDFSAEKPMIRERLADFFSVPLQAMFRGSEFKAVSNLLQKTLLFAPLGALLTVSAYRMPIPPGVRKVFLCGLLLACFTFAMGIELGQILSPRHTPDFTDVLLCSAGALVGMAVTARHMASR